MSSEQHTPASKTSKGISKTCNRYDNSSSTQRAMILRYFSGENNGLTVGYARNNLGIMYLPARIMELRKRGYHIVTNWIIEHDRFGVKHRNGLYSFHGKKEKQENGGRHE